MLYNTLRRTVLSSTYYHTKITACISSYVQGQSPGKGIREYFYYIDHQGQLFLDDAKIKNFTSCFKEKDFLLFFYQRLKRNTTARYVDDFPFMSPCGREKNYIRFLIFLSHFFSSSDSNKQKYVSLSYLFYMQVHVIS